MGGGEGHNIEVRFLLHGERRDDGGGGGGGLSRQGLNVGTSFKFAINCTFCSVHLKMVQEALISKGWCLLNSKGFFAWFMTNLSKGHY